MSLLCFPYDCSIICTKFNLVLYVKICQHSWSVFVQYVFVAVVNCSSLSVAFASFNTTAVSAMTNLNVSCLPGYQFSVGQTWKIVTCQIDGTWSATVENCSGKLTLCVTIIIKSDRSCVTNSSLYNLTAMNIFIFQK